MEGCGICLELIFTNSLIAIFVGPPDSGVRELRSADAKLTIDVPTGSPQILQGDFLQTVSIQSTYQVN